MSVATPQTVSEIPRMYQVALDGRHKARSVPPPL